MNEVLVFPKASFDDLPEAGAWPIAALPCDATWRARDAVETDERWLQPIPYLLLENDDGEFWSYRRRGGDVRLEDRRSCGVGGHVERRDARKELVRTLSAAIRREADEELANAGGLNPGPPLAWLYEDRSAIGRVHVGVIYVARWRSREAPSVAPGEALEALGFLPPAEIVADTRFELWSRLAVDYLDATGP